MAAVQGSLGAGLDAAGLDVADGVSVRCSPVPGSDALRRPAVGAVRVPLGAGLAGSPVRAWAASRLAERPVQRSAR